MVQKGLFITFEGIDGSGKTTQLRLAEKLLSGSGRSLLVIREPGSTPLSERIRRILLDRRLRINEISELMLYQAARAELVQQVIRPALEKGTTVLSDRFYDSTTAYQGFGRGLDLDLIEKMNRLVAADCHPDLTFIIDIDYAASLSRRKKKSDRLESESKAFFSRVRHGFLEIARKNKKRVVVIDGSRNIDEVFQEVAACLKKKLRIK
jgi:dTMP kinase